MAQNPNVPVGVIYSTTGQLTIGTDAFGRATATLPVIAPTGAVAPQCSPGDDASVRSHDVDGATVIDANTGQVIDTLPANTWCTYQATASLVWRRSEGRILSGAPASGTPANTTTPKKWLQAQQPNGTVLFIPAYQ